LTVLGPTALSDAGTLLDAAGETARLDGGDVTINSGATLNVDGGTVQSFIAGGVSSTFLINAGGTFSGHGVLSMSDAYAAVTTAVNNNGTINAANPSGILF